MSAARRSGPILWGAAGAALHGGESGDLEVVAPFPGGVLVALIDGLGHGPEASAAACAAAAVLRARAGDEPIALVQRCHEGIRRTRGVVLSLASFDVRLSSMTWIGVGNVEGVLVRADPEASSRREGILSRGGVVGFQLPSLRAYTKPVAPGDTLILATDGIRSEFGDALRPSEDPQETADALVAAYAKTDDDALVVVARYLGGVP